MRLGLILVIVLLHSCGTSKKGKWSDIHFSGDWYFQYEKSDTIFFNRASTLFTLNKEIKLEFPAKDSVIYSNMEIIDFEIGGGVSEANWSFDKKTEIIKTEITKNFDATYFKLINYSAEKMVLLRIQ